MRCQNETRQARLSRLMERAYRLSQAAWERDSIDDQFRDNGIAWRRYVRLATTLLSEQDRSIRRALRDSKRSLKAG